MDTGVTSLKCFVLILVSHRSLLSICKGAPSTFIHVSNWAFPVSVQHPWHTLTYGLGFVKMSSDKWVHEVSLSLSLFLPLRPRSLATSARSSACAGASACATQLLLTTQPVQTQPLWCTTVRAM